MRRHQLARVDVARMLEPLDSPLLAGFAAALDPINVLADAAPGFVWRLQTEDGDATSIRAFDDDLMIVNMSVWTSLELLGTSSTERPRGRDAPSLRLRVPFPPPGSEVEIWAREDDLYGV